ncbi:MAG: hypothetical protein ACI9B8_003963, partial [Sulfitobacter sp.]
SRSLRKPFRYFSLFMLKQFDLAGGMIAGFSEHRDSNE